jgi:hypothetical protein
LFLVAGLAILVGAVFVFESAFWVYSDSKQDQIGADLPAYQNALWMQRHAELQMNDSFLMFMGAIGLLFISVFKNSEDESR